MENGLWNHHFHPLQTGCFEVPGKHERQFCSSKWRHCFTWKKNLWLPIFVGNLGIHPRNSTWNLEMMVSNRNLLFQGSIFRFHVCFGRCTKTKESSNKPFVKKFLHYCSLDLSIGGFKYFFIFTVVWGRFPIWLLHIFQMGWAPTTNQMCTLLEILAFLWSPRQPETFKHQEPGIWDSNHPKLFDLFEQKKNCLFLGI